MANICEYHIKVTGKKNACYALFGSLAVYDDKCIETESGTNDNYSLAFQGTCKWAVDMYTKPFEGSYDDIVIPEDSEAAEECGSSFQGIPLKEKSKLFNVEVWCNSIDIDDPMGIFSEHYISGEKSPLSYGEMPDEIKMDEYEELGEFDEEDDGVIEMYKDGVPIDAIAEMTGLSVEEIKARIENL